MTSSKTFWHSFATLIILFPFSLAFSIQKFQWSNQDSNQRPFAREPSTYPLNHGHFDDRVAKSFNIQGVPESIFFQRVIEEPQTNKNYMVNPPKMHPWGNMNQILFFD